MNRLFCARLAGAVVAATAMMSTGCAERLTPELVRGYLDEPAGDVSPEAMTKVTRDLFRTSGATAAERFVDLLRFNQGGGGTNNALPVQTGVLEAAGDVFCVSSLVADIATFDGCELGDSCNAELVLDSCLLRIGDEGDEDARGKFVLKLDNEVTSSASVSTLGIELGGWESSRDDAELTTFNGVIAVEVTEDNDDSALELVFASDFEAGVKRKERGFFDDGIEELVNMSAGLRFAAETDDLGGRGSLEVLTFVDEDGGRSQSVSVVMSAEGHQIDAESAVASASLEVRGSNGTFSCTWGGTSQSADRDGIRVQSSGECIDEDGEVFSFDGSADDLASSSG